MPYLAWYYKNTIVLDLKVSPSCQVLPKLTGASEGRIWPTVIKSKCYIRVQDLFFWCKDNGNFFFSVFGLQQAFFRF